MEARIEIGLSRELIRKACGLRADRCLGFLGFVRHVLDFDGFSLDDKRQRVPENDIPGLLACWQHRHDAKFQKQRDARLAELQKQIALLKKDRLARTPSSTA